MSSILKGIVDEGEEVAVIYIDGKPSAKYAIGHEAKTAMERLQAKFPNRQFELKRETRGGIGGNKKVDEAGSPAQQAAIAISMKKRGQKPKHVDEARAKQYVKPFMRDGEQVGWVSSDGYHKKYWQMFAKASAIKHAKLNPDEVQEDYASQFSAEKTATVNPHAGIKDNQFRGAIGEGIAEAREMSPSLRAAQQNMIDLASGAVRRKEEARKAAEKSQREYDRAYNKKPSKPSSDVVWRKIEDAIGNSFPDGDPYDMLWPWLERNGLNNDDVVRAAKKHGYKDLWDYWNTLTQDVENDAYGDWLASDGKNVRTRGQFVGEMPDTSGPIGTQPGGWRRTDMDEAKKSEFRQRVEQQQLEKLEKINSSTLPHWAKEYLTLLNDPKGKVFKAAYYSFPKGQIAREEAVQHIMNKYKVPQEMLNKVKHGEMAHVAMDRPEDRNYDFDVPSVHEDTAYAGGMGQGGNAGQSYRKFKPKSAGTFKEEQLDEKCWDGYEQVGMKKKGAKMVPNCVQKESAIMKGILGKD